MGIARWDGTPQSWVAAACTEYGETEVALWCAELIDEQVDFAAPDRPSLGFLGGQVAVGLLARDDVVERDLDYWPRVWGARGLRYAWAEQCTTVVVRGLDDPHWRVREMLAKVAGQREVGAAADVLARLVQDETLRVQVAAIGALGAVGEGEHAEALRAVLDNEELCDAAERALAEMSRRLDRDLGRD